MCTILMRACTNEICNHVHVSRECGLLRMGSCAHLTRAIVFMAFTG